jgi:multiple sugar transport system substrate-binding protein
MKNHRLFTGITLLALLLLLVAAPTFAQAPIKVVIFVGLGTGTAPDQISAQEALAAEFNAERSDIQIEFLIVPFEEAGTRLLAMVAGGTAPQLVGPMGVSTVSEYIENWTDITPFIEAENFDLSDYYDLSIQVSNVGGKFTGLPLGLYPSFILYNVDAFDAAGVAYPPSDYADTSWTIDELRTRAMLLTLDENFNDATSPDFNPDATIQWGYDDSWSSGRGRLAMWGAENVGRPTNADYTVAVVNSPEWVEGAQWYTDGIHKDQFIPSPEESAFLEGAGVGTPIDSGNLAMFWTHTWFLSELGSAYQNLPFELQLAPVPFNRKGQRIARAHADNFAIPENAQNKEAAWEVMKWLTSAEHIVDVCVIYGCIPARESVRAQHRAVLEEIFPTLDLEVLYEAINYIDSPNHEDYVPNYGRIEDEMNAAFELLVTGENTNAQAVLDETNAKIQAILDAGS